MEALKQDTEPLNRVLGGHLLALINDILISQDRGRADGASPRNVRTGALVEDVGKTIR
jgi:hypothetical protein